MIYVRASRRYFNSCLTRGGSSLLPSLSQGNYCMASETQKAEETLKRSQAVLFLLLAAYIALNEAVKQQRDDFSPSGRWLCLPINQTNPRTKMCHSS